MPVLLAASRPATTALARIRSRQRNSCINLPPQTQIAATKESRSSPATSSTPARNPLDRVLSTQAHHPRRSNPHSARGTHHTFPHRGFFPWRLSDTGRPGVRHRRQWPASETLHICRLSHRNKQHHYSMISAAAGKGAATAGSLPAAPSPIRGPAPGIKETCFDRIG
jgi:hypothetical protein